MAWVNPSNVATGDVLTASNWNQAVVENARIGQPVFTNEAARDAAVGTPSEGMTAYLTASTVAAATGATTAVPTGVTTIYTGSVWVCTTPVGAYSNTSASTTSTSYVTTLTSDSTAVSVALVTGTTALVMITASANATVASTLGHAISVSGATTLSAADSTGSLATVSATNYWVNPCRTYVLSGLTAGTNTFTLNYKTSAGTATWGHRALTVQGVA